MINFAGVRVLATVLFLVLAVFYVGCSKEQPYDTVYKDPKLTKLAEWDFNEEYLYVPSTLGVPKDVRVARAFFQGDEKVVKFKKAEEGIKLVEINQDPRFRGEEIGESPILTIPGQFKDFRCRENDLHECSNYEEENTELEWYQKSYFQPDYAKLKVHEVNTLDLFNVSEGCISEVATGLVDYTFENGVLNVELERTFKVADNSRCIIQLYYSDNMKSASFKVRYFYSIVRLKDLESPNFEVVEYPFADHQEFGYFKHSFERVNENYDRERPDIDYFMHRWNPKNKKVVYHLSESFDKKANKVIKDATFNAVAGINKSLKIANAGFQLELKEFDGTKKAAGDLRYNVIQLIDEPLSNGLLGYGPTVASPRTGEIIQGHVNMYGGVLKSLTRRVWQNMVNLSIDQWKARRAKELASREPSSISFKAFFKQYLTGVDFVTPLYSMKGGMIPTSWFFKEKAAEKSVLGPVKAGADRAVASIEQKQFQPALPIDLTKIAVPNSKVIGRELANIPQRKMKNLEKRLEDDFHQQIDPRVYEKMSEYEKTERWNAEHNILSDKQFDITLLGKTYIKGIKGLSGVTNADGTLKNWEELSDDQQRLAWEKIAPHIYTSTLVHEIGHNLGLRHNFAGSQDAENFYTESEAKSMGMDTAPAYSSIMDYAFSELNELTTMGKYDIAALRYAYAREVYDPSGKPVKLEKSIAHDDVHTHSFKFCTDEHAGLNVGCNRFDEGSTKLEITQHYLKRYDDGYKTRNFRDYREDFSIYGVDNYAYGRSWEFKRLRNVFEIYEAYAEYYNSIGYDGYGMMQTGCPDAQVATNPFCKTLNDIRDAIKTAGKKFLTILKTPDHLCALANPSEPDKTVSLEKLADFAENNSRSLGYVPKTCFDPAVEQHYQNEGLIVRGEAGKYFNDQDEPNPRFPYVSDIGVRGTWVDKLLAMKYLLTRQSWVTYRETRMGSFMENTELFAEFVDFISHITLGQPLSNPVPFVDRYGKEFVEQYEITLDDYIIPQQPYFLRVIPTFGLPMKDNSYLIEMLLKIAQENLDTETPQFRDKARSLINGFSIISRNIADGIRNDDLLKVTVNNEVYAATPEHNIAFNLIAPVFLSTLNRELIQEVFDARANPAPLEGISSNMWEVTDLGVATLQNVLNVLKNPSIVLTPASLPDSLPAKTKELIWRAYNEMGIEQLEKVINYLNKAISTAPENASYEVKMLYGFAPGFIQGYLEGKHDERIEHCKRMLEILPKI